MNSKEETRILRAFGARVRGLRKHKGLSQEDLALQCGLDRTYLGSVERGERNISLINICRIADALGIPAEVVASLSSASASTPTEHAHA